MIIDRIMQIIDFKGINKRKFYIETGLSNGFLDKVKDIGVSKIELILNTYPDINPIWLLTGIGSMLRSEITPIVSEVDHTYKELADARLDVIEGLKFKIATLEEKISELRYTRPETFLHANVAESAPELIDKKRK